VPWIEWLGWESARLVPKFDRKAELDEEEVALLLWHHQPTFCAARFDEAKQEIIIESPRSFAARLTEKGWVAREVSLRTQETAEPKVVRSGRPKVRKPN